MHLVTWLFGLCRAWLPDGSRPAPAHLRALRADLALRFRDPSGGAAARVLRALDVLGHAVVVAGFQKTAPGATVAPEERSTSNTTADAASE